MPVLLQSLAIDEEIGFVKFTILCYKRLAIWKAAIDEESRLVKFEIFCYKSLVIDEEKRFLKFTMFCYRNWKKSYEHKTVLIVAMFFVTIYQKMC